MKDVLLSEYKPVSELVVEEHQVLKPKFPVVEFHGHYWLKDGDEDYLEKFEKQVERLHKNGVAAAINLGNFWGESLDRILMQTEKYRETFVTFGSVDVTKVSDPGFADYASETIRESYKKGMRGLKFFKEMGLKLRDCNNRLISVDDEGLKPIWETAGELNIPVLIHIADPIAFFKPIDANNERIEELNAFPGWSFYGDEFPSYEELMEMQENLISSNPQTKFVIAHCGSAPENLGFVSQQLDRYPNMYIDIAARVAELGRQPYSSKKFMTKYQDRILFGTDGNFRANNYRYYYRFMETMDEYFDYSDSCLQGRWKIYGIDLPDEVLKKIYYENAVKLVPDLAKAIDGFQLG